MDSFADNSAKDKAEDEDDEVSDLEGHPHAQNQGGQSYGLKDNTFEEIDGCTPYVYAGNLKVASDGLERMYKQGREKGAMYFKLEAQPDIVDNGKTISFYDAVARRNIELAPDLIVVEEEIRSDRINGDLVQLLRIDAGPWGFLQKDNVHLFPVRSNREGIFVIGSSRDI